MNEASACRNGLRHGPPGIYCGGILQIWVTRATTAPASTVPKEHLREGQA